jgi:hypothetical protein
MELKEVLEARKHFNALVNFYKKRGHSVEEIKQWKIEDFWNGLTQAIERNQR